MDADKEGFLRSETSLFQIVGRAARNVDGRAIMYADKITKSMRKVIEETDRRREIQMAYNKKHRITPETIQKELKPLVDPALISTQKVDFSKEAEAAAQSDYMESIRVDDKGLSYKANTAMNEVHFESKNKLLDHLRMTMLHAAKNMEFEEAARIRDQIGKLEEEL
jgi:excinuclease ABC subunit B